MSAPTGLPTPASTPALLTRLARELLGPPSPLGRVSLLGGGAAPEVLGGALTEALASQLRPGEAWDTLTPQQAARAAQQVLGHYLAWSSPGELAHDSEESRIGLALQVWRLALHAGLPRDWTPAQSRLEEHLTLAGACASLDHAQLRLAQMLINRAEAHAALESAELALERTSQGARAPQPPTPQEVTFLTRLIAGTASLLAARLLSRLQLDEGEAPCSRVTAGCPQCGQAHLQRSRHARPVSAALQVALNSAGQQRVGWKMAGAAQGPQGQAHGATPDDARPTTLWPAVWEDSASDLSLPAREQLFLPARLWGPSHDVTETVDCQRCGHTGVLLGFVVPWTGQHSLEEPRPERKQRVR